MYLTENVIFSNAMLYFQMQIPDWIIVLFFFRNVWQCQVDNEN